jgi:2-polyprenyl-6-methoxyphenol hydroxylase-like FAD-dependent oxidoreductase
MAKKTVLISGSGIAGPTLAYWLWRRGFEPVLIERAPKLRAGGYVIDFWGVGFEVAERMELIPTLRDVGYMNDRIVRPARRSHQKRIRRQCFAPYARRSLPQYPAWRSCSCDLRND